MHSRLDRQRILVTGANGFIGSHLCHRLSVEGAEVHAVYRSRHPAEGGDQHWWQADLADLAEVERIVGKARPEVIFHLASHVKGAPDLKHVLPTFQSNLQSTVNVLTVAAESNCRRVVLTGSLAEPAFQSANTLLSFSLTAAIFLGLSRLATDQIYWTNVSLLALLTVISLLAQALVRAPVPVTWVEPSDTPVPPPATPDAGDHDALVAH